MSLLQQALSPPSLPSETAQTNTFSYPPHYSFPPFYTLQPNLTTRASQLTSWTTLILSYCAHHRIYRLNPSSPIFTNATLNRRLNPDDARIVLQHLASKGRAEWIIPLPTNNTKSWVGGSSSSSGQHKQHASQEDTPGNGDAWIWWRTPEEWAGLVSGWVEETGQRGTVLTFYELLEGDATKGREFHGLPRDMLGIALQGLARRGKVGLLGEGEEGGVKFY